MSELAGKVVVVTGGSDGIGRALVEALLQLGCRVAACGRNHEKLYDLQAAHAGMPLHVATADVSKEDDCRRFIQSVVDTFGSIDILINNAGISMRALFAETDLQTLRSLMDVNFWGTVYCSRFALPHIKKNKGTIAGVSSIAGFRGLPGRTGYSASKFAVNGFLEALRTELMDYGVNVMWVAPGFTSSNIRNVALNETGKPQKENPMDEDKMMSAGQCAVSIIEAISKRERSSIFTFLGKRTVFLSRFFPALTDQMVHKFYFKNGKLVK